MYCKPVIPVLFLKRDARLDGFMYFFFLSGKYQVSFHSTGEHFSQNLILKYMELKRLFGHCEYHNNPEMWKSDLNNQIFGL